MHCAPYRGTSLFRGGCHIAGLPAHDAMAVNVFRIIILCHKLVLAGFHAEIRALILLYTEVTEVLRLTTDFPVLVRAQ